MAVTHVVTNQVPPSDGRNLVTDDATLMAAVHRYAGTAGVADLAALHELGHLAGSAEARGWARDADRNPPVLTTHDRYGHRIDEVEFHPSWHRLMEVAIGHGLHADPWVSAVPGAHVLRAAGFLAWSQVEAAHGCPVSMTYAAVPALRAAPELAATWAPRLASSVYDPGLRPAAAKQGVLAGMAMTEKQGGSDVRANTTRAVPDGAGWYRLTGHKWFCSAPMNDVFLVLAQAPEGLSCFLLPRMLDDGSRNALLLQRLKDKLGNRANASAEIELDGARAMLVGEAGRGLAAILEMVAATRLDCVLGSAALLRRAAVEAWWHARHRSAFGSKLIDSPVMSTVLADLVVESEAATSVALRLAASVDHDDDHAERALRRIGLPLAKFWVCKRTPAAVAEALECLGGNGYVEDSAMPRLYREAPLNSIWEGSGNIQALDLLRVLTRESEGLEAWRIEVGHAGGGDRRLDHAVADVERDLRMMAGDPGAAQREARRLAVRMATTLQASLLVRHSPAAIADAYCATRLDGASGVFGLLPADADTAAVLAHAMPEE